MNDIIKNFIIWLIIAIVLMSIFQNFNFSDYNKNKFDYSTFINDINKSNIKEVIINNKKILVIKKDNNSYITYIPINDPKLLSNLLEKNIKITGKPINNNILLSIFISWFPMLLLILIWIFFIKQVNSNKGTFSFTKSKAKILYKKDLNIFFDDVAGCEEAKEDVKDIVYYLKDPFRFKRLGSKIPKGILLIGPPGTGKTLLAKAIASESQVPFFVTSGSDFVEMFVGIGASRVRDMFNKAKNLSPCIIFIDEIDAVGRKRGSSLGGNDEREQTLNQILVEMDGFNSNNNIIVIAATNRPDILDEALLRPGRFDKHINIDLPDLKGRDKILKIHTKNIPLDSDVDTTIISRGTIGFSGADLSNLVNEATLFAARNNKKIVSMLDFDNAKDKIILGSERKSLTMSDHQKELTAYHESGHAIIGILIPDNDPIYKVTIIPRNKSLGLTSFLPESDIVLTNKKKLESKISTLYGGRIAEEIIYGNNNISTGSSNDIKVATSIARNMIVKWGYSDILGPLYFDDNNKNDNILKIKFISENTLKLIDNEIKEIIDRNYYRAKNILLNNINILHKMKNELIKYETLDFNQIKEIINSK